MRSGLNKRERGAVVVLAALLIFPLTLLLAFAIDTGHWWVHKRHLQTQADAGALAGGFGPWLPVCDEAAIEAAALEYASHLGGGFNPQYTNAANVRVVLNSGDGTPCQTLAAGHGFLDVKVTEANLPNFFGLIPGFSVVPAINARARVEIQKQLLGNNIRPIAVRDDSQYQCAQAQLFAADGSGSPTSSPFATIPLGARTVLPDLSTRFSNPGGSGGITLPSSANVVVRILLGNAGCASTDAYADPSGGVNLIDTYQAGAAPGAGSPPKIGSVSLPPGLSSCLPDPYFSSVPSSCNVTVEAHVAFAAGGVCSGANPTALVTINGVPATCGDPDALGQPWRATIAVNPMSGPHFFTVNWEQQYGTVFGKTCKRNGNPVECRGSFDVQQAAFSATDDEDVTNSGRIRLVQIGELGKNPLGANSFVQGSTHNFVVTVEVQGLANSGRTDPPIIIRNSNQNSKRTGLIDCGQGSGAGADHDAIVYGCGPPIPPAPSGSRPIFIFPTGGSLSDCQTPDNTTFPAPIDCVFAIPGNRRQKIASAISDRINGSCNHWNAYRDSNTPIPAVDPRKLAFLITSPADLSGNSHGDPIPVLGLATFYVTGVDGMTGNGSGCTNEAYPGSGTGKFQFWGHWIPDVVTSGGGTGTGQFCDPTKFGNCIAVLTR